MGNNWVSSLHPRDYRGRFKGKAGASKNSDKGRPGTTRRLARGANTTGQMILAQALAGAAIGAAGFRPSGAKGALAGVAVSYVALNRRRNAQKKRKEVGLRSVLTGVRIT